MKSDSCPNPEELRLFVSCKVSEPRAELISEHLELCPECEETVVGFERESGTLAERVKQPVAPPKFTHEPECQRLMQSLLGKSGAHLSGASGVEDSREVVRNLRDYQIEAKLGEGGMGTVYKAVHQRLKKAVALKVLPTHRIGDQPAIARFAREMEVLGQLNHPNIVQALDAGEHEGQHYLVMEYVEGCDLSDVVQRCSPLRITDACLLISQAAEGLQYAHEHGFVHRDIKPSNLMLATTGSKHAATVLVKILDLGLARALHQRTDAASHAELTTTGQIMGTPDYMAPEQGGDSHEVDIRADIYSLGATLYKLLTRQSPYADYDTLAPLRRLRAIAQNDPPPIRTKRPDVPEKLAAIVHRMMAREPEQRFATPTEVVQALAPFCVGADLAALIVPSGPTQVIERRTETTIPLAAAASPCPNGHTKRIPHKVLSVLAALITLAAVIVVSTRNGTVEVTSPNGALPNDVKVVVSRGGEEVEVLQADNHWSAKIVNGEYTVALRGGEDRLEIEDSNLTVSRMGRSRVMVQSRKSATESKVQPVATMTPDDKPSKLEPPPTKATVAIDDEKPFIIVRQEKDVRAFKSIAGAIGELQENDIVEVRSNARLPIRISESVAKPLHIRAGAGLRPMLEFGPQNSIKLNNNFSIQGCDVDLRSAPFSFDGTGSSISFRQCRIWGLSLPFRSKVSATDSVLVLLYGFQTSSPSSEVVLDNCVIRNAIYLLHADSGTHTLTLRNCTYHDVGNQVGFLIRPIGTAKVTVNAIGNVFHCRTQGQLFDHKLLSLVTWKGEANCYSGKWYEVWDQQPEGTWSLKEKGLDAWNKRWQGTERDSREGELAFEWGRIQRSDSPDRLREIRVAIQNLSVTHKLPHVGPNWDLVGPGDAYLRALAAEGRGVKESDLRPERLEGGPITLIRSGKEVRGYLTLNTALDAAHDKDIIEIRTDGAVTVGPWSGDLRLLTIRAAPGYTPILETFQSNGTDRLILEGLTCRGPILASGWHAYSPHWDGEKPLFPGRGSFVRIMNCSILSEKAGAPEGWFVPSDTAVPEIVNCDFPVFHIGLPADGLARFRNCVFGYGAASVESLKAKPAKLEIDRCAFFLPEPVYPSLHTSLWHLAPVEVTSTRSIFVSPFQLFSQHSNTLLPWSGTANVFVKPFHFQAGLGPFELERWRTERQTDFDSIELPPLEFDPPQWRILRNQSPGYQSRLDGTDYGANIDRLVEMLAIPN